jgi:hypothetical protein
MRMPTLEQWKDGTSVTGRIRSAELKAIDTAIQTFNAQPNDQNLRRIAVALDVWILSKQKAAGEGPAGQGWKRNERNTKRLFMESLYDFLHPRPETFLDAADEAARKAVREGVANAAKAMFAGASVGFKIFSDKQYARITPAEKLQQANAKIGLATKITGQAVKSGAPGVQASSTVGKSAAAVNSAVKAASGGKKVVSQLDFAAQTRDFIFGITHAGAATETVMQIAGLQSVATFAANCTPLLGVLGSAAKATKAAYDLVSASLAQDDLASRRQVIRPGDPRAALDALNTLMDREVSRAEESLAINGAATIAKAGTLLLDGGAVSGPVIGAAQSLAELMILIGEIAYEYRAASEANTILVEMAKNAKPFDVELFRRCPIVACYYLMIADTSTILFFLTSDYGQAGWQLKVEEMKRIADPIWDKAAQFIDRSRLEVRPLSAHRLAFRKSIAKRVGEDASSVWVKMANLITAGRAYPKTMQAVASTGIGLPTDVTTTNTQATISLADAQRRFAGRG